MVHFLSYLIYSFVLGYAIYQFTKSAILLSTLDKPIKNHLLKWNSVHRKSFFSAFRKTEYDSIKKYNFVYDQLDVTELRLINTYLKTTKDSTGVVVNIVDLLFKVIPLLVLILTTITFGFQSLMSVVTQMESADINKNNEQLTELFKISETFSTEIFSIVRNVGGWLLAIIVAGYVELLTNNLKKSFILPRINVIEQILLNRIGIDKSLLSSNSQLENENDLQTVFIYEFPIVVWDEDSSLCEGRIAELTDSSIVVNNTRFDKTKYRFFIK
ncbi:hypothetical protein [Paenibacillus koleovorans]|uniref:hypothetical protein n=1 Tax=Paenibacillus koleovorans TaxID=121608 RepID=UPI000FD96D82|nr:hypothetical protein [Paenibacillus koleovorans]